MLDKQPAINLMIPASKENTFYTLAKMSSVSGQKVESACAGDFVMTEEGSDRDPFMSFTW